MTKNTTTTADSVMSVRAAMPWPKIVPAPATWESVSTAHRMDRRPRDFFGPAKKYRM